MADFIDSDSSDDSSDESITRGSKQVQFGMSTHQSEEHFLKDASSSSSSSSSSDSSGESFPENVNERLRHQAPAMDQFMEMKHFKRVQAIMSTVVLQMCFQEIVILRHMIFAAEIPINLEYVPLDEKYKNAEFEIHTGEEKSEGLLNHKKYERDVCWVERVLRTAIVNLQKDFYFDDFLKVLNDDEMTRQEENTLLGAKEFNKKELHKLKSYIDSERVDLTKQIQETTEALGNAKDELNDDIAENGVKITYLREWERSRHEQNKLVLHGAEKNYKETRANMVMETEKEERVHEELLLFLQQSLDEYKVDIEKWMERYDKDLEEKEQQVEKVKIWMHNQQEKFQALSREYNKRQQEIDDYKEYKLRKQKEAEEFERCTKAATKIQSWWRGVMFRKGLGPFRRKKGKGKKGGSGRKKNSANKKK